MLEKTLRGIRQNFVGNQVCLVLVSWNKLFTVIVSSEELSLAALCFSDCLHSFILYCIILTSHFLHLTAA